MFSCASRQDYKPVNHDYTWVAKQNGVFGEICLSRDTFIQCCVWGGHRGQRTFRNHIASYWTLMMESKGEAAPSLSIKLISLPASHRMRVIREFPVAAAKCKALHSNSQSPQKLSTRAVLRCTYRVIKRTGGSELEAD